MYIASETGILMWRTALTAQNGISRDTHVKGSANGDIDMNDRSSGCTEVKGIANRDTCVQNSANGDTNLDNSAK